MTAVGGNLENKTIGLQFGVSGVFVDCEFVGGKVQLKSTGKDSAGNNIYANQGTWTSAIIDIGDNFKDYGKLFASETKQGTSSIKLETRTSDDGIAFDEWQTVTSDGTIISTKRRRIQVRVTFYVGYEDVNFYISQGNSSSDAKNVFNNDFIDTSNGIKLKRDYKFEMTKDTSWTGEGELHKKAISKNDWYKINNVNVLPSEKLSKTLILHDDKHKKYVKQIGVIGGNDIIPNMTSASKDGITVTSYGDATTGTAGYYAFNNSTSNHWGVSSVRNYPNPWIMVKFDNPKIITSFWIEDKSGNIYAKPDSFRFEGSNNGTNWNALYTGNRVGFIYGIVQKLTFNIPEEKQGLYNYYRLYVTEIGALNSNKTKWTSSTSLYVSRMNFNAKTLEGKEGWETVSGDIKTHGMDSISPLLDRVNGVSPLDSLNGDFEIIQWTDETNSTRTLEMSAIPKPQFIAKSTVSNIGGSLNGVIASTTSSNVRFLLTNNNSTWYKWDGSSFENVTYSKVDDILTLGNTYDELTNADYSKWTHSKINIGAFLKDDDTTVSKVNELGIIANSPINTSQVSDLNFYILNTTAKIELDLKGLWLSGQLSDLDLTRVQYRVLLNDKPYFPLNGEFTKLDSPPLNIDILFKSNEIKVNDWNTLRVEFKDSFGTFDYWQNTFVGKFSTLMFMDTNGNYYSDDVGKVLQYLDFGSFFGGQYSVEHEVIIKNQYGYTVKNFEVSVETINLPNDVAIQLSDTNDPFTPQSNLILPNELNHDEQVSFYIRMISGVDSIPNGDNKFNISVKAKRKV